jgi:hypothetical protein
MRLFSWVCLGMIDMLFTVKIVEIILVGVGRGGLDLFFRLVCHVCSRVCSFECMFS